MPKAERFSRQIEDRDKQRSDLVHDPIAKAVLGRPGPYLDLVRNHRTVRDAGDRYFARVRRREPISRRLPANGRGGLRDIGVGVGTVREIELGVFLPLVLEFDVDGGLVRPGDQSEAGP